ncbi:MAG: hypothetical protein FWD80_04085, partial [Propionibacteriaceae bacterium]|nr:hypothetical protein [Propionibacteriaceae bacterium]
SSGTASPTVSTSPPTVTVTVTSGQPAMTASYVFGGTDDDAFNAVAVAPDGSIIVAGLIASVDGDFPATHGARDALIAKLGADGSLIWAKTYGGGGDDAFNGVAIAPDGSIIAVGNTTSTDGDFARVSGGEDAVIVKVSPDNGALVWAQVFGGELDDIFNAVAMAPDGAITAAGVTASTQGSLVATHGGQDAVLVSFTPDGQPLWANNFGGSGDDSFAGVAIAADGSIIAVGKSDSADGDFPNHNGVVNAVAASFTPAGAMTWGRTYGGTGGDQFNAVTIGPDGALVAAGDTRSSDGTCALATPTSPQQAMTITLTNNGVNHACQGFMLVGNLTAQGVAVASDGTVFTVGSEQPTDSDDLSTAYPACSLAAPSGGGPFGYDGQTGYFTAAAAAPDGTMVAVGQTRADSGVFAAAHGYDNIDAMVAMYEMVK